MKLLPLLLVVGCSTMKYTGGIPNLDQVDAHLWRSGEPKLDAWGQVKALSVSVVVKLDRDSECPECKDEQAVADVGLTLIDCAQPPYDDGNPLDGPSPEAIACAQNAIREHWAQGVLIHCVHGQDRTGFEVEKDCRERRKLSRRVCEKELFAHGYHPALLGLEDKR